MADYRKMMENWREWRLDELNEANSLEPKTKKELKQSIMNIMNALTKGKKPPTLVNGQTGEVLGEYSLKGPTGGKYEWYLSATKDAFKELK